VTWLTERECVEQSTSINIFNIKKLNKMPPWQTAQPGKSKHGTRPGDVVMIVSLFRLGNRTCKDVDGPGKIPAIITRRIKK